MSAEKAIRDAKGELDGKKNDTNKKLQD